MAMKELIEGANVDPGRILFVNLIASPEGLAAVKAAYPQIRIITAQIDTNLDGQKFIIPGLGDFGCRYFGTELLN